MSDFSDLEDEGAIEEQDDDDEEGGSNEEEVKGTLTSFCCPPIDLSVACS